EQEHVGPDMDGDREPEPHLHPGRVRAHGKVDEAIELREVHDLLEPFVDHAALEAVDRPAQVDVLTTGEVRVEAGAELEQRADGAANLDSSGRRAEDAGDQPEERRLARAVPAHESDRL